MKRVICRLMRKAIFLVFLTLACMPWGGLHAQLLENKWQSLGMFPHGVECIYFLDLPGPPRIGFVGDSGRVLRTTDGGTSWSTVLTNDSILPSDFTFANSDTGWFANFRSEVVGNYSGSGSPLYKTTDGGLTWVPLNVPVLLTTSVYYNRSNGLLFASGWEGNNGGKLCLSSDGGATWSVILSNEAFNGFAFMNGDSGIVTERNNGAYRTTDGGKSWAIPASYPAETWQAAPDTIRRVLWEASEIRPYPLFNSTDFGEDFSPIERIPPTTGCTREGSCGELYLQTSSSATPGSHGILQSTDGVTWTTLTDANGNPGPTNILDTRFYVKGDFVYAGGTMPGDTIGRLWRYVADSTRYADSAFAVPEISTTNFHMVSTSCLNLDSSLYLIYHNDCIPAILVSATLAPTERFAVHVRDTLPHEASGFYPITIEHLPNGRAPDSTELYLHYYADGKDLYDTVPVSAQIIGADIASPFQIVADGSQNATIAAGDTVVFTIQLTDSIPLSLGLDSITFATTFDSNVLSFQRATAEAPWTLLRESRTNSTETLVLQTPVGVSAVADTAIAHVYYIANVAPNASTDYVITDMLLNGASFDGCAGVASLPLPPTVTVVGCGDTLLRRAMTGEPMVLLGMEYAGDVPTLLLRAAEQIPIECDVFDEIGDQVWSLDLTMALGTREIPIRSQGLRNGLYFVTVHSGARELASARFAIER